jgi:accessory gene regulator protein AgrB
MSYLRYLCLIAHSGAEHVLCCVLVLFFFVFCALFSQFIWIVNFLLPLLYSLTFIGLVIRYIKSVGNEFKLEIKLVQKQRSSP